ncbi:methyltransferase domain-containing protein [Edaphobacter aggregans]|uniref:methyltransferase domain-containing protein n=1 Tax=Edaphobacter aggregans TaxID=570835 RepID=UPI0005568DAF|nr:methyltransferase domain-containing protein [Edaphobacter aggregans]
MTAPSTVSSSGTFDRWAQVYDHQLNPLLTLEERTLPALLPEIAGTDVLDVGCGTGRWLSRLEALSPKSLAGIDCSPAMLERARLKLAPATALHLGDASALPGSDGSVELIVASFVLSYIDSLTAFADECARVLRAGGQILLSDMHPVTAIQRNWTRAFRIEDASIQLPATTYSLDDILSTFADRGFDLIQLTEPSFGEPERILFVQRGKLGDFDRFASTPAIYLLKLQKRASPTFDLQLANVPWSANESTWDVSPISVQDGLFVARDTPHSSLDLTGYVLLPGLINAHDHLEFALFPNLGRPPDQPPFRNAAEWAQEIHQVHAHTIAQHLQVPLETRLWWGAIRNLLSGVTTVCHHNPLHPALTEPGFPIRVLSNFGWAHSLAFDPDLIVRFQCTPPGLPFIIHAAEGTDPQSCNEIMELDRINILNDRTALVHGLALGTRQIALLNERGVAVILCPTSNRFLFNQTLSAGLLTAIERKALGSDSPLTSSGDLLDELYYLHSEQAVDPAILYNLVTTNPAAVLRLNQGEGRIMPGKRADFIAVRDIQTTPAQTLAQLTSADVELVVLEGRVQVASPTLYARLSQHHRSGLYLLQIGGIERYVRAPLPHLFESAEQVLGPGKLRLGNKEVRHLTTI